MQEVPWLTETIDTRDRDGGRSPSRSLVSWLSWLVAMSAIFTCRGVRPTLRAQVPSGDGGVRVAGTEVVIHVATAVQTEPNGGDGWRRRGAGAKAAASGGRGATHDECQPTFANHEDGDSTAKR